MTDEDVSATPPGGQLVPTPVEGELRIRDVDLGVRLEFARPRKIRDLIAPHRGALLEMGPLPEVEEVVGKGQKVMAYFLNRKQAIFITAKSDTPKATEITIEIIERFDAYEQGDAPELAILKALNDPPTMRGVLLSYTEKVLALEAEKAAMLPKVEAHDRIAGADGSHCITDAAKALQVRPKVLFDFLARHGWTYRRVGADHWCAYQNRIVAGDLVHKVTTVLRPDGSEKTTEQVRVTPQGLTKLAKLIGEGLRPVPPATPEAA